MLKNDMSLKQEFNVMQNSARDHVENGQLADF